MVRPLISAGHRLIFDEPHSPTPNRESAHIYQIGVLVLSAKVAHTIHLLRFAHTKALDRMHCRGEPGR